MVVVVIHSLLGGHSQGARDQLPNLNLTPAGKNAASGMMSSVPSHLNSPYLSGSTYKPFDPTTQLGCRCTSGRYHVRCINIDIQPRPA